MQNLVIDIGNTRTKTAAFHNGKLVSKEVLDTPSLKEWQAMAYNQNVENVILSATAEVPPEVEGFFAENFYYLRLGTETPLPIAIQYQTPHTLGRDRIAAAAGAAHLFSGENVLVIDAGTCITLDLVSAEGVFLGGNISPGVGMRLKAMHHFTARLPLVEKSGQVAPKPMSDWLGSSTEQAMRHGAELGALLEVRGFIEKSRRAFRPLRVVFTGGDSDFFVKSLKTKIFAIPNLVLIGLDQILKHNVEKNEGF